MEILIATIGKWKRAPEQSLYEHYIKRLRWPVTLRELSGFPKHDTTERQHKETTLLLETARDWGAEKTVCLDETGKALSSIALANHYQDWQDAGTRKVAWLIGGDVGFDKSLLKNADLRISFGTMTWPHLLVRVLLAEQLYRSHTIMTGHPYHRV